MNLNPDDPRVGVALIGAGMVAKTHIAALSDLQDMAVLRAVVSRTPATAKPLADLYDGPAPHFTSDLADIAADPSIDMAIVATPPSVRDEVLKPLVAAGKHILLEKPVARTTAEARDVVDLCNRAGVTLGLVFQHRTRPPAQQATELVQSGVLGRLGVVEIAVPLWRDQSYYDELGRGTYARDGGGVMMTNGIHSLNLALSLTGPVSRVQAMTATSILHRMEAEDFATAGLTFANGAVGSFVASTAMFPHRTEVITLHFENASLRMDKDSLDVSWRDGRPTPAKPDTPAEEIRPLSPKHEWHQAVIADFIDAVRQGHPPLVSGEEALRAHDLIEAIEMSSRTGQAIDLPV